MKLHCSYTIFYYTAILFCSFDEVTCFTTTKKNVDTSIYTQHDHYYHLKSNAEKNLHGYSNTKYRYTQLITRLNLSSIDQARLNTLDGFYFPPLLENDSELIDDNVNNNNNNIRSSIMSSLPSSQPQIPIHMRIAKVCIYLN